MEPPQSKRELQKFVGRVVALSRFISRLGERSLPFFEALRGSQPFRWTESQQEAFEALKKYLVELTTLKPPPPKVPLLLYVAVAPKAVSAVLVQEVKEGETLKQ